MTQEEQIRLYRLMEMVIYFDLNQEIFCITNES